MDGCVHLSIFLFNLIIAAEIKSKKRNITIKRKLLSIKSISPTSKGQVFLNKLRKKWLAVCLKM